MNQPNDRRSTTIENRIARVLFEAIDHGKKLMTASTYVPQRAAIRQIVQEAMRKNKEIQEEDNA